MWPQPKIGGTQVPFGLLLAGGVTGLSCGLLIFAGILAPGLAVYQYVPFLGRARLYIAAGMLTTSLCLLALAWSRRSLARAMAVLTCLLGLYCAVWYFYGNTNWSDTPLRLLAHSGRPPTNRFGLQGAFSFLFIGIALWFLCSDKVSSLGRAVVAAAGTALSSIGVSSLLTAAFSLIAVKPQVPATVHQVGLAPFGALLCTLFGALLVRISWIATRQQTGRAPRWAPALVMVTAAVFAVMWWQVLDFHRTATVRSSLQLRLHQSAGQISNRAHHQAAELEYFLLSSRDGANGREFAARFMDRHSGYVRMAWMNRAGVIEWEQHVSGWDSSKCPLPKREALLSSAGSTALAISLPLPGEGHCFLRMTPVYQSPHPPGVAMAVISMERLVDFFDFGPYERDWTLRLRDPRTPSHPDQVRWRLGGDDAWMQQATIDVFGIQWVVEMYPTQRLVSSLRTWLPEFGLLFGLLAGVLGSLTVHALLSARERARQKQQALEDLAHEGAEREHAERERDRIFALSLDMLAVAAFDGSILHSNPAWANVVGHQPEQERAPIGRYLHVEDLPETELNLSRLKEGSVDKLIWQSRLIDKHGEARWILWAATCSLEDHVIVIMGKDISHLMAYQSELVSAAEQLRNQNLHLESALNDARQATLMKNRFLATMSHEIRTPMNGVLGITELLLTTRLDEEQREYAATVLESGRGLMKVLNDILDLSKIEAGKMQVDRLPFQPAEVLAGVESLMSVSAMEKQLRLQVSMQEGLPNTVVGDPLRLRQVLMNLVGNAVKFTERGTILIRLRRLDNKLLFEVEDTGIGIPPQHLPRLFQSFTQADQSTTRKYGGTGLGLAICKQLVELMGGEIGVQADRPSGSLFWFTLPLCHADLAQAKEASAA